LLESLLAIGAIIVTGGNRGDIGFIGLCYIPLRWPADCLGFMFARRRLRAMAPQKGWRR